MFVENGLHKVEFTNGLLEYELWTTSLLIQLAANEVLGALSISVIMDCFKV